MNSGSMSILCLCLAVPMATGLSCFECTGTDVGGTKTGCTTPDASKDSKKCTGDLGADNEYVCSTISADVTVLGVTTKTDTRTCEIKAKTTEEKCKETSIAGVATSQCYCKTDNCNGVVPASNAEGVLSCFACIGIITGEAETGCTKPDATKDAQKCTGSLTADQEYFCSKRSAEVTVLGVTQKSDTRTCEIKAKTTEEKCKETSIGGVATSQCYCKTDNCNGVDPASNAEGVLSCFACIGIITGEAETGCTKPDATKDAQKCTGALTADQEYFCSKRSAEVTVLSVTTKTDTRTCEIKAKTTEEKCTETSVAGLTTSQCYCKTDNCNGQTTLAPAIVTSLVGLAMALYAVL